MRAFVCLTFALFVVGWLACVDAGACGGACQSTSNYCATGYIAGLCCGGSDIECCPSPTSCSGQCQDNSCPCAGSYVAGLCPGPANVQCCQATGGGGNCGGNCPGGACPRCPCGTTPNYLSNTTIASLLQQAGFPGNVNIMLCIIHRESGGNANAINWNSNDSMDVGLGQINDINDNYCGMSESTLCNPLSNAQCITALYNYWGGFTAWKPDCPYCGC